MYCIFDVDALTVTPWVSNGPVAVGASHVLGMCLGTNGRVHLVGNTDNGVDQDIWQQTIYPATGVAAVYQLITTSVGGDFIFQPVAGFDGKVLISVSPDGVNFSLWKGKSADTITFTSAAIALPAANYIPVALVANSVAPMIIMRRNTGTYDFQYALYDGAAFGPYVVIGAGMDVSNAAWSSFADTNSGVAFWGMMYKNFQLPGFGGGIRFWGTTQLVSQVLTVQLVGRQLIPC